MCYWVGTKKVREEMLRRLQQDPEDDIAQLFYKTFVGKAEFSFKEYFVAIGKSKPTLTVLTHEGVSGLQFANMRWSLPWSYTNKKTGKTYSREMINSTCEKVFFVHKESIFSRRCVIPLDGYYEFFHFSGEVYPHFIKPKEGIFFAGGVWDEQVDKETGEVTVCFSIITTPPNNLTKKLHNNPKAPNGPRMLMLLNAEDIYKFLHPESTREELQRLFNPLDDNNMEAYPVSRFLRKEFSGKINSNDVRQKIDYPELALS